MSAVSQVQTQFGTVSGTEMVFVRRGWLRAGTRTIPLNQIASVRQDTRRHLGRGIIFLLLASTLYPVLAQPAGVGSAALLSLIGVFFLWGNPLVVITTRNGHTRRIVGMPWHLADADRFVATLRSALFERSTGQ